MVVGVMLVLYSLDTVEVEHGAACSHLWHLRQGHVSIHPRTLAAAEQ